MINLITPRAGLAGTKRWLARCKSAVVRCTTPIRVPIRP